MPSRVITFPALAAIALVSSSWLPARGEDAVADELKALRQLLERQGQQLETLSAQVARLTARMDGGTDAAPAAPAPNAAAERSTVPPAETGEFAVPVARAVAPQPPPNVHIVVKGDSLEKIAKTHGTTAAELQKINRITDPKKLQIGQQLLLPPQPKKEGL